MFVSYSNVSLSFFFLNRFCFACIVYFSCMGLIPIPYIVFTEIFPKKVTEHCILLTDDFTCIYNFNYPLILDSTNMSCSGCIGYVDIVFHFWTHFPVVHGNIRPFQLHVHNGFYMYVECYIWHLLHSWDERKIIWTNYRNDEQVNKILIMLKSNHSLHCSCNDICINFKL